MRRNPATVVVLAGTASEALLTTVGGSMNVSLIRPDTTGSAGPSADRSGGSRAEGSADPGIEAAAAALRRAAGISSPYVLVAADPLAAVAAGWQDMWDVARPDGAERFELRAAEAIAAWRGGQFELPDYYLVLAAEPATGSGPGSGTGFGAGPDADPLPDFYLGPLRSARPHRVAVAAAAEPAEQAAAVLHALGALRHGPWWPPLDELISAARGFYPGSVSGTVSPLLS
jgi:hypothetical protein